MKNVYSKPTIEKVAGFKESTKGFLPVSGQMFLAVKLSYALSSKME